MTISVTNIGTANNNNVTTLSITVPAGGVPAGALVVLAAADAGINATSGGSVADTKGNTYTRITEKNGNNAGTTALVQAYYAANVTALVSGNTITHTLANNAGNGEDAISAFYATGVATTSPLDAAVTATATGAVGVGAGSGVASVTSGTPAVSGELFVGIAGGQSSNFTYTQDTGHGWAAPPNEVDWAGAVFVAGGTQVNSGTGTKVFGPTLNDNGSGTSWAVFVFGFKPLAAVLTKPRSRIVYRR